MRKTSDLYWDKYRIESDPELLGAIVDELETLLPPSFDRLAGLELGGVPLAGNFERRWSGKAALGCSAHGPGRHGVRLLPVIRSMRPDSEYNPLRDT